MGELCIVVGCGVSGLSTGIRLLEAGFEVEIRARDLPPRTTSNIAAAIWYPYKAYPKERVLAWGKRTLDVLYEMTSIERAGVYTSQAAEFFHEQVGEPWWLEAVHEFGFAAPGDLPSGYTAGYEFETITVETGVYLDYLMADFRERGGRIVQQEISELSPLLEQAAVVLDCAGLAAAELTHDSALYPVRGQVLRAEKLPIDRILMDDYEDEMGVLAYIVPRRNDCILGGTAQLNNTSLKPDPATTERIVERCARLAPVVREARILEERVGLRPGRDEVRVEAEQTPGGTIVHNYGHSGAGITLSWGCAEEAVRLVQASLTR